MLPFWAVSYKFKEQLMRSYVGGVRPGVAGPLIYDAEKMTLAYALSGAVIGGVVGGIAGPFLFHVPPMIPLIVGAAGGGLFGAGLAGS